jgi:hypothetical protein
MKYKHTAAEIAAMLAKPNLAIDEHCVLAGYTRSTLYALWERGEGPDFFYVGTRRIISRAAHDKHMTKRASNKTAPYRKPPTKKRIKRRVLKSAA